MNKMFVDTAGWMAMADSKDPLNGACRRARDQWLEAGGILVVSNYVVDESLPLIRLRLGMNAAEQWWTQITKSQRCKTVWITPEQEAQAIRWFFSWKDQSFSLTDCTSFVLMKELHIPTALTADHHFLTAGFQILPRS